MIDALNLSDSSCVEQSYTAVSAYVSYVEQRPPATFSAAWSSTSPAVQYQPPGITISTAKTPVGIVASGLNSYALHSRDVRVVDVPSTLRSSPEWYDLLRNLAPDSILRYQAVKDFLQIERAVNFQAMDQMYKLVTSEFGDTAKYEYELINDDDEEPYLILSISTEGLDMSEILDKEIRVFDAIARSDVLASANKYHVISAV